MYVDVFGEAHGLEHLRTEHAAVADLDPLLELRVEGEDLERGLQMGQCQPCQSRMRATCLRVRVVGRLEADVLDAHLLEEHAHEAYKSTRRRQSARS